MAETIDYNGKKVPLTKDGFPSLVYLPKEDRVLVTEAKANSKRVYSTTQSEEIINIDFLQKGMYLLKINIEDQTFNSKIIKE